MRVKLFVQTALVLAITITAVFFVFATGRVDVEPVTAEETQRAMDFLQASLRTPRFTYIDFLHDNAGLRGATPYFSGGLDHGMVLGPAGSLVQEVVVPHEGLYSFYVYYSLPLDNFNNLVVSLRVNDELQFEEAAIISLPVFWQDETKDFPLNRFGDEVPPAQLPVEGIHHTALFDAGFTTDAPLLFHLQAGANLIELRNETSREIYIGRLGVASELVLPSNAAAGQAVNDLLIINAIEYTYKNSPFVQLQGWRNPALTPFHPVDRMLNVVNMSRAGDEVFFEVYAPTAGYYGITLHALTESDDFSTFVTVRINGEVPFAEAASFPLMPYADERFRNHVIADATGEPYLFFLQGGINEVSVRLELAPVNRQLRQLRLLIDHVNHLGLEVRRVTGRDIDQHRTWRLTRYIPDIAAYLEAYDIIFRDMVFYLQQFSPRGSNSAVANNMLTAISLLNRLRERPDDLPLFIEMLNGVNASVLQMAGVSMDALVDIGITINALYIGRVHDLPIEQASIFARFQAGLQSLWASYTSDRFVIRNREDALNVWVNHSYLHVDLLQQMVDARFTPATGIEVNLSVMPDPARLILSRAAGTNPDVALGIPAFMPFELGARGALYDLTSFDDFWYFMGNLVPGAVVGYIFNERVFALPETVGFWTTVYRTDILEPLGLSAPDTWADVAAMQATLQRFDMSFFKPIASGVGYKWFFQTSPLIYQHGGKLFSEDGLSTAIDQPEAIEAISFLGDLFTTFALAEQVPAFFNSFRFGQTPVGIMDPPTYMLLMNAAPELLGQWNIAPFPGTARDDEIYRWFIANGVGSAVFDNTYMAEEAWEFLKWYLSAETQRDFAMALMANFNILWISANLEALQEIPIDYHHRETILESIHWLRDVPRSPGQYMLERRLSDIWNTMVFEGATAQTAIDLRVIDINREFTRKMVEFGFLDAQGNQVNPYVVRELDWVVYMIESRRQP